MLVGGPLFGRQRRLPHWILAPDSWLLTPGFLLYALCSMPSLLFFMFMSMIRVRPVWMIMGRCFVFVPVAVVGGVRRSREQVIVMAIVMPMPVLMHSSFM